MSTQFTRYITPPRGRERTATMGRSADATARRAEKRGRSVEEELAVEQARSVGDQECKPAVGPKRESEEPVPKRESEEEEMPKMQKREAEASSEATKERKPRQPVPTNHKQGRRSGAMRKAAKESGRLGGGDGKGPPPRPAAPAAKPAAATKAADRTGTKRASTRDGLVVWLVDDGTAEATPLVILQSELREPPEPRASPKYLLLEPLPAGHAGSARWVHSRAVLPLDARLASLWPQLKLVPQRREAVRAAKKKNRTGLARVRSQAPAPDRDSPPQRRAKSRDPGQRTNPVGFT